MEKVLIMQKSMLKLLEQLILLFPQMMNALLAYFLQAIKVPAVLPVYKDPAVLPEYKVPAVKQVYQALKEPAVQQVYPVLQDHR